MGVDGEPTVSAPAAVMADEACVLLAGTPLLAPVSFTLPQGSSAALVGPNGSGKTTTLRMLAGITAPTTGSVAVLGSPPADRDPTFRRRVAGVLGPSALARNLTLTEHLVLVGTSWGSEVEEAEDAAARLVHSFGIADLAARYPHELSSGQTQLVCLALALARPSSILLLDEPEQRLDPGRLARVTALLQERQAAGTSVVFATHRPELATELADLVVEVRPATPT